MPERFIDRALYWVTHTDKLKQYFPTRFLGKSGEVMIMTNNGHFVLGVLPDGPTYIRFREEAYEPETTAFLEYSLRPGNTVLVVGAHFGHEAVDASYLVGPDGKVICFEPTPSTFSILQINCQDRDNMHPVRTAIGREIGIATLTDCGLRFCASNTLNSSPRLPKKSLKKLRSRSIDVPITTIDHYYEEDGLHSCDLMLLDVENWEADVLVGARNTITRFRPAVTIETGDQGRTTRNSTRVCLNLLKDMGYKPFEYCLQTGKIIPHKVKDFYPDPGNLLCLHKERSVQ